MALSQNALLLTSIGLRACIESVCNHLGLPKSNLQKRIDGLFKAGHVSAGDKKLLHAIRFLGNDAAHDIKQPTPEDIRIALDIIEHLLNSVFILGHKAANLETVVESYSDFVEVLKMCVSRNKSENAMDLRTIIGKQLRQIAELKPFEIQLSKEIDNGTISFLTKEPLSTKDEKDPLYRVDTNYSYIPAVLNDSYPF
ncbi:DUF4145 domain-containing protein [Pseudomonas mohnii]